MNTNNMNFMDKYNYIMNPNMKLSNNMINQITTINPTMNPTMNPTNISLESARYEEQINNNNSSFLSALDEYKTSYVNYNTSPDVQDYNTSFMNSQEQLQIISNDMFQITKTLQTKIEEQSNEIAIVAVKLAQEKQISKQLESIINNLNGVKAGSTVMIDDSKTEYKFNYYKNVEIFMGIIILLALLISPKVAGAVLIIVIIYKLSIFQQFMKILGNIF